MRMLRVWLMVLGLLFSHAAVAQETAREAYERATAQYALGKYAEAALIFERAFELKPDPAILYNAAQAHRLGGNKQRALELYQSYLRLYGDRGSRVEVQRHVEALQAAIEKDRAASSQNPMTLRTPPAPTQPKPATPTPTATTTATVQPPPKPAPPQPPPERKPAPAPTVVTATPAPTPAPAPTRPAPTAIVSEPPPRKKIKPWVWGIVAAAIVVVGAGVGVGVAIGTRGSKDPDPSFGKVNGN